MKYKKPKYFSYIISASIHIVIMLVFLFITLEPEAKEVEYLTIGFGSMGSMDTKGNPTVERTVEEKKEEKKPPKAEEKEIEVPKAQNPDDNVITPVEKKKKETEKEKEEEKPVKQDDIKTEEKKGIETENTGFESFGYDIDFGGKGVRKIYSYQIPPYPAGVSKEIDVKLRFTIMPDGTVGQIIPLIKADSRLESAAIGALKTWRFEPLPSNAKKIVQTAIITFPFRLR